MSKVFESYELQYCQLSADLSKKTFSVDRLDGEQRKQRSSEIKAGLDEAEALINKMDSDACGSQPNLNAALLSKLREYKSDLYFLKSEAKRTASTFLNQAARGELLEGRTAHTASQNQRDRLLLSTEKLNNASNRIGESREVMLETEEIGVSLLQDLHQQRQSLLQADDSLHGVDHNVGRSSRVIASISRRMNRNKCIIGSVVSLLLLVIALTLYFKLSKRPKPYCKNS